MTTTSTTMRMMRRAVMNRLRTSSNRTTRSRMSTSIFSTSQPSSLHYDYSFQQPARLLPNTSPKRSWASKAQDDIREAEFVEKETPTNDAPLADALKGAAELIEKEDLAEAEADSIDADATAEETATAEEDVPEEEEADNRTFFEHWYGENKDPQEAYGKIIDSARLVAEMAYDRSGAVVGALAEAGGDEGAAERYLLGFLALLEGDTGTGLGPHYYLPDWWKDDPSRHKKALVKLSQNRAGNHYMKRCVDVKTLKQQLGLPDYYQLETVAVICMDGLVDLEGDDEEEPQPKPFPPSVIEKVKQIWGPETVREFWKKTKEELEIEQAEKQGLVQKMEEGEWWGAASNDDPTEAYKRLIDAARRGTLMAYDQGQEMIGAVADALERPSLHSNFDEDHVHDENCQHGEDTDHVHDENCQHGKDAHTHSEPTEVGPNARAHFEKFLSEMKSFPWMPDWWNEEHDKALWELAEDLKGDHCLAYPLDKEDLAELYDDAGVRQKVEKLAGAAAAALENDGSSTDLMGDSSFGEMGNKAAMDKIFEDATKAAGIENWQDDAADDYDVSSSDKMGEMGDLDIQYLKKQEYQKQDYAKVTVAQLKDQLKERGLKISGTKAELIERLEEAAAADANDSSSSSDIMGGDKGDTNNIADIANEDIEEDGEEKQEYQKQDYSKLTVAQLKDQLKERGLKVSGQKAELIERLEMDSNMQGHS